MNEFEELKITYKTIKKIMEEDRLKQDNSFKRVLFYISTKLADEISK